MKKFSSMQRIKCSCTAIKCGKISGYLSESLSAFMLGICVETACQTQISTQISNDTIL